MRGWFSALAFVIALTFQSATAQVPGFTPLMGLPASGAAPVTTTWDPARLGGGVSLSGGNLTAESDGSNFDAAGLATSSIGASSKVYYEGTVVDTGGSAYEPGLGYGTTSTDLASLIGNTSASLGYFANGVVFFNAGDLAHLATFTTGAIIGVAVDTTNAHVWFTLDGVTWNNDIIANQNPVGNVGGIALSVAGTLIPAFSLHGGTVLTANFGNTTFTYSTLFTALQVAGYTTMP